MTGDDYLATGFRDVDGTGAGDTYIRCLLLLDALPFYRDVKQRSYELLALEAAGSVLDAGCGLGFDVFRMAERVSLGGRIMGLDASFGLIAEARNDERAAELPVSFCAGDLKALPFDAGAFDRCRIDRVLQHVRQPARAIAELARVLRPGGIFLAYDNDWNTFKVASDDAALTHRVEAAWRDAFAHGSIGRNLPALFDEAGLTGIEMFDHVSMIENFEIADRLYDLTQTVDRLAGAGEIADDEGRTWLAGLEERSRCGQFAAELTAYTVIGRKPD